MLFRSHVVYMKNKEIQLTKLFRPIVLSLVFLGEMTLIYDYAK